MKLFANERPESPIVNQLKEDGTEWTIKEKLWLGLSIPEYKKQFIRNPVNWLMIFIFAIGVPLIVGRFAFGLGWVTHASNDYPWGLSWDSAFLEWFPFQHRVLCWVPRWNCLAEKIFIPLNVWPS